jgi:hypothetical protein
MEVANVRMKCVRITVAVMGISLIGITAHALAQTSCHGDWRVGIIVAQTSETCDPDKTHIVVVDSFGNISPKTRLAGIEFRGTVDTACRNISFVITRNGEKAEGQGQISGAKAQGTWSVTYPSNKNCHGVWQASKR